LGPRRRRTAVLVPEADRPLRQEGRRSRVNHPPKTQRRFEIRAPRMSAELVFK